MKITTFYEILLAIGALVMGASLLLWWRDRKVGHPAREVTHSLLTAIALFLMYPVGGGLILDLLPSSFLALAMWSPVQIFLFVCGLVTMACSIGFYRSSRKCGNPTKQHSYAIAIVIGLLLTWFYGFSLVWDLWKPILDLLQ